MAEPPERLSAVTLLERYPQSLELYRAKRYAEAAAILEPFFSAGPTNMGWSWNSAMYDLACEEALAGRPEKALDVLTAWQAAGISVSAEQLATDTDLASLHGEPRFQQLLASVRVQDRLWSGEPARAVAFAPTLGEDARIAGLCTLWAEARFNFAFSIAARIWIGTKPI
ncbi:TPR end-of-group domain-containing protein [Caulobacter sp. KR2-114]|uniref:TPR end-of-group domain-containing protein n=1 Tax=Caulobacter sp. KR2-114 TaxID=3400912 RepID=UPI003C11D366